jgi:CheY-like chemotaxis protein
VVDVGQVVRDLAELMAVTVPKSATLHTELSPRTLPVAADGSQIAQVVMNLLSNAVDALPGGKGEVHVRTRAQRLKTPRSVGEPPVVSAPDGVYAVLEVRDSGVGMTRDTLSQMFDPFFTTKEHGHGLGLAAVVGIVGAGNGHMAVDSVPGAGTTVSIYLPLSGEPEGVAVDHAPSPAGGSIEGRTFLVADDEDGVRRFVAQVLSRAGAAVLEARDGQEAIEVFDAQAGSVDAAVLDLSMPRMGGVEVHRHIRATAPHLPVVLASGFDVAGTLGDVVDDPDVAVLQKPYGPRDLVQRLTEMLHRPR